MIAINAQVLYRLIQILLPICYKTLAHKQFYFIGVVSLDAGKNSGKNFIISFCSRFFVLLVVMFYLLRKILCLYCYLPKKSGRGSLCQGLLK